MSTILDATTMDLGRLVENHTVGTFRCIPMDDRHGRDCVVLVTKLAWEVAQRRPPRLAYPQRPVRSGDLPHIGGPSRYPSTQYPSDLVEEKPGTDVLLVGNAHPPLGREVSEMAVGVRVETTRRTIRHGIRVTGRRVWTDSVTGVAPGRPGPLREPTPLRYELAFGGIDDSDPRDILIDYRNPAGTGFIRDRRALIGREAPRLEDPREPLDGPRPAPAGFGPLAASSDARTRFAGTMDDDWRWRRAPLLPEDYDPRFACVAPPELWSDVPLHGDEPVEVVGATPEGVLAFQLPRFAPAFEVSIRGVVSHLPTHLDTLLVDAEAGVVELVWRTRFPMPKRSGYIDSIVIYGSPPLSQPLVDEYVERGKAIERSQELS